MSSIDRRIVEMRFDNGEFKRRVHDTIQNLSDLAKALKLEGAANAFEDIQKQADRINFDGIARGVETIESRFSVFGGVAFTAIQRVTNAAIDLGKNLVTSVIDPIFSGGKKRALNLEQAQFQLEGLKIAWDDIKPSILNAVKGTAFGLDEAARAASQLAASQVPLDKMEGSLRAISGTAAMAGASYDDIANIFVKVAGQGRVMGDDLNRIGVRGLNAAAALGDAFGKTEGEIRELVSEGKVSFEDFAYAMNKAFGDQAFKANDTFTGAVSNMQASLARIGANFFTPWHESLRLLALGFTQVFDRIEEAMSPAMAKLGEFMIGIATKVNTALVGWAKEEGFTDRVKTFGNLIAAITSFGKAFLNVITPIGKAFATVFGLNGEIWTGIDRATGMLAAFAEGIRSVTAKIAPDLEKMSKGFFATFGLIGLVIKEAITFIFDLVGMVKGTEGTFLGFAGNIGEVTYQFYESVKAGDGLKKFFGGLENILSGPIALLNIVISAFKALVTVLKESGVAEYVGQLLYSAFDKLNGVFFAATEYLKPFVESLQDTEVSADGLRTAFEKVKEVVTNVIDFFKGPTSEILDTIATAIENVKIAAENGGDKVDAFFKSFEGLGGRLKEQITIKYEDLGLGNVWTSLKKEFEDVWKIIGPLVLNLKDSVLELGDTLITAFGDLSKNDVLSLINFGVVTTFVVSAAKLFKSAGGFIDSFASIGKAVTGALTSVKDTLGVMQKEIKVNMVLKIAIAIGILAASIWLLAQLDAAALWRSVGAIAALAVILGLLGLAFVKLEDALGENGSKMGKLLLGIIGIAVAIIILAKAVEVLAGLDVGKMWSAVGAVVLLIAVLGALTAVLNSLEKINSNGITKAAVGLLLFAGVLYVMSKVIELYASMDPEVWEEGGNRILTAMGVLVAVALGLSKAGGDMTKASFGIAVMVGALYSLFTVMNLYLTFSADEFTTGMLRIAAALGLLVVAVIALSYLAQNAMAGAAAMIVVAGALYIMAQAIALLTQFDLASVAIAVGALILVLGALVVAVNFLQTAAPGALAMLTIAAAMLVIAAAIYILAGVPFEQLKNALFAIGVALIMFVGAMWALSAVTPVALAFGVVMLAIGAGVLFAAIGLLLLGPALIATGAALKVFGQQMEEVSEHAQAFFDVGMSLIPLGIGLAVLGVAVLILGTGFMAMGVGLMFLALTGAAGTAALMSLIEALDDLSLITLGKLALVSGAFALLGVSLLAMGVGTLAAGLGLTIFAVGWALASVAIMATANPLINALTKMSEKIPPLMESMTSSLEAAATGITPAIAEIQRAFDDMAVSLEAAIQTIKMTMEAAGYELGAALIAGVNKSLPLASIAGTLFVGTLAISMAAASPTLTPVGGLMVGMLAVGLQNAMPRLTPMGTMMVVAFGIGLQKSAPVLKSVGMSLVMLVGAGIASASPTMQKQANALVVLFVAAIVANNSRVQTTGKVVLASFVLGLVQEAPKLTPVGLLMVATLIRGVTSGMASVNVAGRSSASTFAYAVSSGLASQQGVARSSGYSVGTAMTSGMVSGLYAGSYAVKAAAASVAVSALRSARNTLGIASPSKEAEKDGMNYDLGLAKGMYTGVSKVTDASKMVAEKTMASLQKALVAPRTGVFDEEVLTLRPVLDLSLVEREASRLNSMFGQSIDTTYARAAGLSRNQNRVLEGASAVAQAPVQINYSQTNNSPKALSTSEIYRRTKNQLSVVKESLT